MATLEDAAIPVAAVLSLSQGLVLPGGAMDELFSATHLSLLSTVKTLTLRLACVYCGTPPLQP